MKNNNFNKNAILVASCPRNISKRVVTIEKQLDYCRHYCSVNGFQVLKEFSFCTSDSESGIKTMKEIINFVHNHTQKISIISYNMRRIQGNSTQLTELDNLRLQGKLELHFLKENRIFKLDNPVHTII